MKRRIGPWQVWWADLDPQVGSEQAGTRPVIVVGTSLACDLPNRLAVIVPLTSRDRRLPFQPRVNVGGRPGFAMTDQVKSVSQLRLIKPHGGTLNDDEIDMIKFALRKIIDVS